MRTNFNSVDSMEGADQSSGFWPAYADMMSSFALILFFVMLLAYLSNIRTGNNLRNTESQLADVLTRLAVTQAEYNEANINLSEAESALAEKETELEEKESHLLTVQIELDEANAELENSLFFLSQQQATIAAQSKYVREAQSRLTEMYSQMEIVTGVRKEILEQIKANIEAAGPDSGKVLLSDSGSLILSDSVFFDSGSSSLKSDARPILDQLITALSKFLADPDNVSYIDSIVIAGHTDSDGSPRFNRSLSIERANAVVEYMLSYPSLSQYECLFCPAGYGQSRPVASNDTNEGRARNRRIEVSIVLKDETVMDMMNDYLDIELPDADE